MKQRPLRLVHVINSLGLGGAERNLVELVKYADRTRFDVQVLCIYSTGPLAEELDALGVSVTSLNLTVELGVIHWWHMFRFFLRVRPDIVHAHLPEARWLALPAARLAGVRRRVAHVQNTHWQWRARLRMLDKWAVRSATSIIACSEAVKRYCREAGGYPIQKVTVIYNGADARRFSRGSGRTVRRRLALPQDACVLICVASLIPQKGHKYLIEAFAMIRKSHQDAILVFVGSGEPAFTQGLRTLAEEHGVLSSLRFLGNRRDVPDLLSATNVFVLASLWEGLPLAVVEAGFAGLPAVTTAVGGLVEVIADGENGYLVPPKEPEAFAAATILLLGSSEDRRRMGKAAVERARQSFDSKVLARTVEDLYLK